jgi:tRNA(Arg) A34 adenosine deaminase TadA
MQVAKGGDDSMQTEFPADKLEGVGRKLLLGTSIGLVSLMAILGLAIVLSPEYHLLKGKVELSDMNKRALMNLGTLAARNRDVPIAAIILYGDSIIGRGYNTVVRDTNAAGHAEINAISDALVRIGPRQFRQLQRDGLVLVSTLEPCPMCRGAIMEYGVQHVVFLKGRSFYHWTKLLGKELQYEWIERKGVDEDLQDSLLLQHPDYDPARVEF